MSRGALGDRAPAIRAALQQPGRGRLLDPRSVVAARTDERPLRLPRPRPCTRLAAPKQLSVRFIAGTYTPPFWMGHSMIYDGSVTGGVGAGRAVPLPFAADGGPNRRFERGWTRLVDRLADWSIRHHLSLLHLAWPGLVWSEMGVTQQMMDQPGYSYAAGARHAPAAPGTRLGRQHAALERGVPVRGVRTEPALRRSQAASAGEPGSRPMHPAGEQPDRPHQPAAARAAAPAPRRPDAAARQLLRLVGRLRRRPHDVRGVRGGLYAVVHAAGRPRSSATRSRPSPPASASAARSDARPCRRRSVRRTPAPAASPARDAPDRPRARTRCHARGT